MKARLEYVAGSDRVVLESMQLEDLDRYTYNTFETVDDIKNADKYKKKIADCAGDGDVIVSFDSLDLPLKDADKYTRLGISPFEREESISVLIYKDRITPTLRGVRDKMASFITNEAIAREFYDRFEEEYTSKEKLEFLIGVDSMNSQLASNGIKRIMLDYTSGYEGYFIGRIFIDTLRNFESVKGEKSLKNK